jgi:FlaA1/EpsC-like NDP-sugar epimerase
MSKLFEGKRILVTGGTGSLGQVLVRRPSRLGHRYHTGH